MDLDTGIKMTYLTCGPEDGIPLLLIHGATDSRISWSQVAPKLADAGFRCYIPELRGHGKTDKPEAGEEGYTAAVSYTHLIVEKKPAKTTEKKEASPVKEMVPEAPKAVVKAETKTTAKTKEASAPAKKTSTRATKAKAAQEKNETIAPVVEEKAAAKTPAKKTCLLYTS